MYSDKGEPVQEKKHLFYNDYSEGAHTSILEALTKTNLQQEVGYGLDTFSLKAAQLIKEKIGSANVEVHFVHSGGMANLVSLASMLNPAFTSVIAAESSHVNVHEGGAIEALGHKINVWENRDGKLTPEDIRQINYKHYADEHMVLPRVVSISQASEVGTIYSLEELRNIRFACDKYGLLLYIDGARLGSALTAKGADVTLQDLPKLADIFSIGGTKNGALFGEAIVVCVPTLQKEFRRHIRQRAAHVAKGRVLGIQFLELMKGDLYFDLARHGNECAQELAQGMKKMGFRFMTESPTNQIFPILPHDLIHEMEKYYGFYVWKGTSGGHSAIRLVTSWATPEIAVDDFLTDIRRLSK